MLTSKFLIIIGFILVSSLLIYLVLKFFGHVSRLDDEEHELRRQMKREYRDAQADLEHEIDIAERRSRREYDKESK